MKAKVLKALGWVNCIFGIIGLVVALVFHWPGLIFLAVAFWMLLGVILWVLLDSGKVELK